MQYFMLFYSISNIFFSDQRLPEVTKRSERERKQIEVEVSRSKKWAEMMDFNDPKKLRKYFEPQAKYREKMINRIYKGVPDSVRGRLWYILLDIKELKETQEGVYERMKDIARRHSPDIRQVILDPIFRHLIKQMDRIFFFSQPHLHERAPFFKRSSSKLVHEWDCPKNICCFTRANIDIDLFFIFCSRLIWMSIVPTVIT